jgi:nitrogen fixation/metabolism regulation signal transduction histidine kinase
MLDIIKTYPESIGSTLVFDKGQKDRNGRLGYTHSTRQPKGQVKHMGDEKLFTQVFENAPLIMMVVDENMQISRANRAALTFLGRSLEETLGLRGGTVFGCLNSLDDERGCGFGPDCSKCKVRSSVKEAFKNGTDHYRIEGIIPVAKDDRQGVLNLLVSTSIINLEGKRLVFLSLENVTDIRRAEMSLKDFNEYLKLLNSILRHDIKNSLTIMQASLEMTDRNLRKINDESIPKILGRAYNAIRHSNRLIDEVKILEEAIPAGFDLKVVDLREIIDSITGKYQVKITVKGGAFALADEALGSAFDNIISNAVTHGKTDRIDIEIKSGSGVSVVRIADYGIGIPAEIRSKIFEKGFTSAGKSHTGLGLYIAKSIINRYGGVLRIEKNKPNGAAFVIELKTPKRTKA